MIFHFEYPPYVAIIGDLKNSKNLKNRRAVQARLETVLEAVNQAYPEALASKFMITLGDEFQGLLKTGTAVLEILERIERGMHPVQLRFGVGVGEITTDIHPDRPLGADGPAYYLARSMIDALKASEKRKMESKVNIRIDIQEHPEVSDLLNAIFALAMTIKDQWTPRQIEVMNAYLTYGTQIDAAKALGINQPAVQKALAAANFYPYRKALDTVAKVFAGIRQEEPRV